MLDGHEIGAYYISWSPDDQHLIVCGPEDCNELCVWDIEVSCVTSKTPSNNYNFCISRRNLNEFFIGVSSVRNGKVSFSNL